MDKKPSKADQFLQAMQTEPTEVIPPPVHSPQPAKPTGKKTTTREGLKHFGGYLDDEYLEKIALLRVRLKVDNSELIKLAVDDLYRKHMAKRAFGDA